MSIFALVITFSIGYNGIAHRQWTMIATMLASTKMLIFPDGAMGHD